MKTLLDHLRGLSPGRLADLAALHLPDGPPTDLRRFAAELSTYESIVRTLTLQTLPALQLAEVLALRAGGTRRRDLAAAVGVPTDDPGLDRTLTVLEEWSLAWPDDNGDWISSVPLHSVIDGGFGFAPSAVTALEFVPVGQLQRIAYELGAPVGRDRAGLVGGIVAALSDADVVRAQFAAAPGDTRELLLDLVGTEPYFYDPRQMAALRTARRTPLSWAVDHGLMVWNPAGGAAMLPSEVGVVLRDGFRAPFDPEPPHLAPVEVSTELVDREGSAATRAALATMTALLDECGREPVPTLKNGGVGVRELRRLGKLLGCDETDVRLWLVLAGLSGLIGLTGDRVAPSVEYDSWLKLDPAGQYGWLLDCWIGMDAAPLLALDTAALLRSRRDEGAALIRQSFVMLLADLPEGRGAANVDVLSGSLMFAQPLIVSEPEQALASALAFWREAELLGVGAHLAPTALGRALVAGDLERITDVLSRFLPAAQSTVILQSDLTAVATGPPSAQLTAFLDLAADRESRGGAHTWRFSEASVRRAFDAGSSADELLVALREAANAGRVPQPLEYLVTDLARRHGNIRVRQVGCVVHSDDPMLLEEILRVKSLARLGLTALAPTVLVSVLPPAETLAALRAAGYAPAGENTDGTVALEKVVRHRAVPGE
ncbi:helicase-associated domain-containing protein [Dactylosporangium fulvum]|uniref:Helicase-associated domain-containing protein n=1 Tax=Dactylosporangium fulvum TaxID=53359 RepID=A0ABY5W3H6_9ACTN|nr:helicase-associated domain-containing protein [Dactylosporangium fulvum]UWP83900.1 helicase-associated domain-containing protein [Dactylosporangium fulvum]